jgi:hypothetical protein
MAVCEAGRLHRACGSPAAEGARAGLTSPRFSPASAEQPPLSRSAPTPSTTPAKCPRSCVLLPGRGAPARRPPETCACSLVAASPADRASCVTYDACALDLYSPHFPSSSVRLTKYSRQPRRLPRFFRRLPAPSALSRSLSLRVTLAKDQSIRQASSQW